MKSFRKTLFLASVCFALLVELSAACSIFETESSCSNPCEPTCDDTAPDCNEPCIPGSSCVCSTGFVRDRNGVCTILTACPPRELVTMAPTNPPEPEEQVANEAPPEPIQVATEAPPQPIQTATDAPQKPIEIPTIPPPEIICKQNSTLQNCANSCDASCEMPERFCTKQCEQGTSCSCDSGYVRNVDGDCILVDDCPKKAGCEKPHEILRSCGNICEPTCDDLAPMCTDQCDDGSVCICEPFYVRSESGECILSNDCPQTIDNSTTPECQKDEVYNDCGSACPATCKNPNLVAVPCITLCVQGCFCVPGFVRNGTGVCVPAEECGNSDCESDEEFKACGTDCGDCKIACYPGCFCKEGYSRNSNGKCERDSCSGLIPCLFGLVRSVLNFFSSLLKKIFG